MELLIDNSLKLKKESTLQTQNHISQIEKLFYQYDMCYFMSA